jgi:mono/diheme cytochrome c family protein
MKPSHILFAMVVAACFGPGAAHADATKGGKIAQQWCSSCHLVGPTAPSGPVPQGPPSFQTVAKSGMTAEQLRAFLSHPHGAMPNLTLTRAEIDDLISYIATLR